MQLLVTVGAAVGGSGALLYALDQSVEASGTEVHPTKMPWSHDGLISSFDHARWDHQSSRLCFDINDRTEEHSRMQYCVLWCFFVLCLYDFILCLS